MVAVRAANRRQRHGLALLVVLAAWLALWSVTQNELLCSTLLAALKVVPYTLRPNTQTRATLASARAADLVAKRGSKSLGRPLACSTCKATESGSEANPQSTIEALSEMKQDIDKANADPRPRGGKRVGPEVWFDLVLDLPLGLRLDTSPKGDMVGVSEVMEGGSAFAHNQANMLATDGIEQVKNFIQPGDRIVTVNSVKVNTQEDIVEIVQGLPENPAGKKVSIKFARSARGPITIVFPGKTPIVVQAKTRISQAAAAAGHPVDTMDCEEGCSGRCWHINDRTEEIYQLCIEGCTAGEVPSNSGTGAQYRQILGLANVIMGKDASPTTGGYDNTEPLELRPCPEIYERLTDPYVGEWQYTGGKYKVTRSNEKEQTRRYEENGIVGVLRSEGDWLVADLPPHGSIRIRPGESTGLTQDMDSQFRATGTEEWGEKKTAFRL